MTSNKWCIWAYFKGLFPAIMCRSWLNPHQKEGIWDSDYCREQWKKDTHRKNSSRVLRQSPGSGLWPVNLWWKLLREVFFFLYIFFNIWTQQQKRWDKTESEVLVRWCSGTAVMWAQTWKEPAVLAGSRQPTGGAAESISYCHSTLKSTFHTAFRN